MKERLKGGNYCIPGEKRKVRKGERKLRKGRKKVKRGERTEKLMQ